MDPEVQWKSGRRMTVADLLDQLQVGRFHSFHLLRMILAWAIFSTAQESTPYMFPGEPLSERGRAFTCRRSAQDLPRHG